MRSSANLYSFIRVSMNGKTGPIPVTYSNKQTCPDACKLKNNGCYAENGHVSIHWNRLDHTGLSFEEMCDKIRALPRRTLWRHNVAGDLPGQGDIIDHVMVNALAKANAGKRGFTFTHKPVGRSGQALINATIIDAANRSGFTINLSAEGLKSADKLYDLGIAPVVVVVPIDAPKHMKTPAGRRVVVCPAESDVIQCSNCGLCANADRKGIVAFRAHGVRKHVVNKRVLQVMQ